MPQFDTPIFHLISNGRGRLIAVGGARMGFVTGANRLAVAQSDDSGKSWSVVLSEATDHLACLPRIIGDPDGAMLIYNPCPEFGKRYYFSEDGGRTWQARVFFRYAFGAFELVTAVDGKRWVAVTREGPNHRSLFAWISDNGGKDWIGSATGFAILSGNPDLHAQSIVALADGVVLAYVGDGQVLRSADRGESWKLIDTGLARKGNYRMSANCTDGKEFVVLGGGQGLLIRSTDAGLTWRQGRIPRMNP